ncbi:hypothetical protein ZYGR_0E00410 [Zygosaccharomyces rouxii]|uniref:Uncharacterized protein n=1 Tax=Zygosaccharomyces rouxii TaxID=4956 RepID=A0A1Q2ZU60_ZYGRO|nr:hypothetical protein ZYGR_0E00410 [Zygosaccharomyces rouxii]
MSAYEKQPSPVSPPSSNSFSSTSSRSVPESEPAAFGGTSPDTHARTDIPSNEKRYNDHGEHGAVDESHASFQSGHASLAPEGEVDATRKLSRIYTGTQQDLEKISVDYTGCPTMGGGRPYPPALPSKDAYEVTYDGPDDPTHPFNWSIKKKVWLCCWLCLDCIAIAMGSSILPVVLNKYVKFTTLFLSLQFWVLHSTFWDLQLRLSSMHLYLNYMVVEVFL